MQVEVHAASETEKPTVANLLALYLHDFGEYLGTRPGENGWYAYRYLDSYWVDPLRSPFLLRADGRLAGFALVSRGSMVSQAADVIDLAEFFVLRALRRQGVGAAAAHALFASMPGVWEVRVVDVNAGGRKFWERTVTGFTGGAFEVLRYESPADVGWHCFRFTQRGEPPR